MSPNDGGARAEDAFTAVVTRASGAGTVVAPGGARAGLERGCWLRRNPLQPGRPRWRARPRDAHRHREASPVRADGAPDARAVDEQRAGAAQAGRTAHLAGEHLPRGPGPERLPL